MTGKAKKTTVLLFIVLLASGILNFSLLAEGETAAVKASVSTPNPYNITLHGWKRSHQYSALINLYTFFCQNKTHNPKSRLEFRVIRQTDAAAGNPTAAFLSEITFYILSSFAVQC